LATSPQVHNNSRPALNEKKKSKRSKKLFTECDFLRTNGILVTLRTVKPYTTMPQQFFGGDGKSLATASRLPIKSFAQLVDEVLNVPATINVSKQRYLSLSSDEQNKLKQVAYIVPCTFVTDHSKRRYEFAKDFSLICLDIDNSDAARPYYSDAGTLETQLDPYNFAVYETASSTEEKPRIRIIVEADSIPVDNYRTAISMIAAQIGLPALNSESKVAVQPMYLPSIFHGDDPDFDHPLIHFRKDGRAFKKSDLEQNHAEVQTEKRVVVNHFNNPLEFLKAPVEEISLDVAKSALYKLDPDMIYQQWLEAAFALRHQFFGEQEDQAYEMFDEWSSQGEKYKGSEDTYAKWKSIKPHAAGRNPVTIRTLLFKAQEAGWDSHEVIKKCFDSTKLWIMTQAKDERQLMKEGPVRVAATPLQTASEEESLLNMLIDRCKKEFGCRVSMTTMKKELKNAKHQINSKKQQKSDVQSWTKGLCYVAEANEFFRQSTGERMSPESTDNRFGRFLTGSDSDPEKEVLSINGDTLENARPVVRARDYLLNLLKIPEVYTYAYDPRNPNEARIFSRDGVKYINTYVRSYPEPKPEDSEEAGEIFLRHLNHLIAEPEYVNILMDFLAYHVQFPGHKIRWGVLMQGCQGCGKTAIAQAMQVVLGRNHVKSVDASVLLGSSFNDWASGAQIVTLEEIRVAGKNRYEVMNKLKPCISNDVISLNEKFESVKNIVNVTNYLMFTNHKDSLALTDSERRYFVLESRIQTKEQIKALGENYFKEFFKMLNLKAGGLRHFFETWEIDDDFDANGHAPSTTYLESLVEASAGNDVAIVREILRDADNPLVSHKIVVLKMLDAAVELEGHGKIKPQRLSAILDEEGLFKYKRMRLNKERYTIFIGKKYSQDAAALTNLAEEYMQEKISREEIDFF